MFSYFLAALLERQTQERTAEDWPGSHEFEGAPENLLRNSVFPTLVDLCKGGKGSLIRFHHDKEETEAASYTTPPEAAPLYRRAKLGVQTIQKVRKRVKRQDRTWLVLANSERSLLELDLHLSEGK